MQDFQDFSSEGSFVPVCDFPLHVSLQVDFWLHPVSTELPVDIRVSRSSLSPVKEYLTAHNIPFTIMTENLQVYTPSFLLLAFS